MSEISALSLTESVHLRGKTTAVEKELLSSSIFVFFYRFEGLTIVIIEALLCCLSVVVFSCTCGPKDINKDGKNGLFLIPHERVSSSGVYLQSD